MKQQQHAPDSSFISKDKQKLYRFLWTAVDLLRYSSSSIISNLFLSPIAARDHIELFRATFQEITSVEFLKRALESFRTHQTILEILTVSFLENLRNFEQFIFSIYPRPPASPPRTSHLSSSSPMTQRNEKLLLDHQIYVITLQLGQLCRDLLNIFDTLHELSQRSPLAIDEAIRCYELLTERDHTISALRSYMNHQRVHTCHNYLLSPSPNHFALRLKTTELYNTLFQRHLVTVPSPFLSSFSTGSDPPQAKEKRRIESFTSCQKLWWWDVRQTQDWDLFRAMESDILREESCVGIEALVVELIRSHAPSDLIYRLVR
jgi:hypothetical protein